MADKKSDLKKSIFQNILNKKFTKANKDIEKMMKSKVFTAIDDFKKKFKYNPGDVPDAEPETAAVAAEPAEPVAKEKVDA